MTLLWEGNSEGMKRCDARCHNATKPKCACICGGRYHGKKSWSPELRDAINEYGKEMVAGMKPKGVDVSGLETALGGNLFRP